MQLFHYGICWRKGNSTHSSVQADVACLHCHLCHIDVINSYVVSTLRNQHRPWYQSILPTSCSIHSPPDTMQIIIWCPFVTYMTIFEFGLFTKTQNVYVPWITIIPSKIVCFRKYLNYYFTHFSNQVWVDVWKSTVTYFVYNFRLVLHFSENEYVWTMVNILLNYYLIRRYVVFTL